MYFNTVILIHKVRDQFWYKKVLKSNKPLIANIHFIRTNKYHLCISLVKSSYTNNRLHTPICNSPYNYLQARCLIVIALKAHIPFRLADPLNIRSIQLNEALSLHTL